MHIVRVRTSTDDAVRLSQGLPAARMMLCLMAELNRSIVWPTFTLTVLIDGGGEKTPDPKYHDGECDPS